jgi:hypothetical protein
MSETERQPDSKQDVTSGLASLAAQVTEARLNTRTVLEGANRPDGTPDVGRMGDMLRDTYRVLHAEIREVADQESDPGTLLRLGALHDDVAEYLLGKAESLDAEEVTTELLRQAEYFSVSAAACYRTGWEFALRDESPDDVRQAQAGQAMASELFSRLRAARIEPVLRERAEAPRYLEDGTPLAEALAESVETVDAARRSLGEDAVREVRRALAVARAQTAAN